MRELRLKMAVTCLRDAASKLQSRTLLGPGSFLVLCPSLGKTAVDTWGPALGGIRVAVLFTNLHKSSHIGLLTYMSPRLSSWVYFMMSVYI